MHLKELFESLKDIEELWEKNILALSDINKGCDTAKNLFG